MSHKMLRITIVLESPRDESEVQLRLLSSHMENAFHSFKHPEHSLMRKIEEVSINKKKTKKKRLHSYES